AGGQRAPSRGARPRRREVRERQTRRTARRHHRYRGGRIKDLDPQVLTIAHESGPESHSRYILPTITALSDSESTSSPATAAATDDWWRWRSFQKPTSSSNRSTPA